MQLGSLLLEMDHLTPNQRRLFLGFLDVGYSVGYLTRARASTHNGGQFFEDCSKFVKGYKKIRAELEE